MNTVDIPQNLRKEADRYAAMQGDKQHTNHRRKTFRFRNHLYRKAAAHIEQLQARVAELEKFQSRSFEDVVKENLELEAMLRDANGVLRSASEIAKIEHISKTNGTAKTNWVAFKAKVDKELLRQHFLFEAAIKGGES